MAPRRRNGTRLVPRMVAHQLHNRRTQTDVRRPVADLRAELKLGPGTPRILAGGLFALGSGALNPEKFG